MKKSTVRVLAIICLVATLSFATAPTASANSAQQYWEGVTSTGALITSGSCPLQVLHEDLTFDIPALTIYEDYTGNIKGGSATVSAAYTFYNPADYSVSATLAFPFGKLSDFNDHYDRNGNSIPVYPSGAYGATVDGVAVETTLRHTYSAYSDFSLKHDLPRLRDGYNDTYFLKNDTPIHHYSYVVSDIAEEYVNAVAEVLVSIDPEKTKLIVDGDGWAGGSSDGESLCYSAFYVDNGDVVDLYFAGEPPLSEPIWSFSDKTTYKKEIRGTMTKTEADNPFPNFYGYAMRDYKEERGISEQDWFNAVVDYIMEYDEYHAQHGIFTMNTYPYGEFWCWYQYEITVDAGQSVENVVVAPLHPGVDFYYDPDIFYYTYLLSPASSWADFGTLDITINTPYYVINSNIEFEKGDGSYTAHLDELPAEELVFSLCESENPEQPDSTWFYLMLAGVGLLVVLCVVMAIVCWPVTLVLIAILIVSYLVNGVFIP